MKYGDVTLDEAVAAIDVLNGRTGLAAVMAGRSFADVKYGGMSLGQFEALVNIIGEDNTRAVLAGDLTVERVGATLQIKEAVRPLFDRHGRRIPPRGLVANVCDPNREFHLVQPEIDYGARLERLARHFPSGVPVPEPPQRDEFLKLAGFFQGRSMRLLDTLRADEQLANLLKGVHLPVCLPFLSVSDTGYGQAMDDVFVPSVERAYKEQFPDRAFTNHRHGELDGQVTVLPGTRHERLAARMHMAESAVVGIYFPNPLQGYSVHAQREQMATLPESLLLAGGIDTATAWVVYPDVLARDYKTPGYDCSAVQWQSSERSLYFGADVVKAYFGYRGYLAHARVNCSGGLLFIG